MAQLQFKKLLLTTAVTKTIDSWISVFASVWAKLSQRILSRQLRYIAAILCDYRCTKHWPKQFQDFAYSKEGDSCG